MKQPDREFADVRIKRVLKDGYLGVRAPMDGQARLVHSAGAVSEQSWGKKLRPDWITASVARQLREKRRSTDQVKYSHLVSGSNLRFAW